MSRLRLRLRSLRHRNQVERELDEELQYHLQRQIDVGRKAGLSPEDARRAALCAMGPITQSQEECRDMRQVNWIENLLQDLRYAVRSLRLSPGFTLAAVLTLGLGIGANTAIFSLVWAVVLKPLPFREPARLVAVWDTYLPLFPKLGVSPPEREAMEQQSDLFEQTAWYRYVPTNLNLIQPGAPGTELHATFISSRLLPTLGTAPTLGRGFSESESSQSVLLNHRLWTSRFAANPAIIGQPIRLGDQQFTVVGVMPPDFQFPEATDIWLPQGPLMNDELTNPVRHSLGFIARLRPGATEQQATARAGTIFKRLAAEHPKTSTGFGIQLAGLQQDLTGNQRPTLFLLLGAVGLVLLIACGNVANLLLSRAASRTKEIAIRTAVGATMGRLVRQLLTESLVLAVIGGALGLGLAVWGLITFSPVPAPIDATVLLFLLATVTAAGLVFGLAPVLQALKVHPMAAIKSGSAQGRASIARGAIVVLEFAFALVVVIGAGILVKSFIRLMDVPPGFNPNGVLTLRLSWPASQDPKLLFDRINERVRSLPGVQSIATANTLPLVADRATAFRFSVPGSPLINPDALPVAQVRAVSPEYFQAMQIPLKSGRTFNKEDLKQPVNVVINQGMARRFWPGRDAVGEKFNTNPLAPKPIWVTIAGVVGDVKQFGLDSEPTMEVYFPNAAPAYVILQTTGDPRSIARAAQREMAAINPALAISDVRTMDQVLEQSTRSRRWAVGLLAAFAGLALVLALVGIYGVMAWAVGQRTREIGIRIALGASRGRVIGMVIQQGAVLCAIGLVTGVAGAILSRHFVAGLTFQVSTVDPWIYGATALLMVTVGLLACYIPARRASRVDPLIALRWD